MSQAQSLSTEAAPLEAQAPEPDASRAAAPQSDSKSKSKSLFVRMLSGAVLDQALLSAANFLVGLVLIRHTSDLQYGYYILVTNAFLLLTSLQNAYIAPAVVPLFTRLPDGEDVTSMFPWKIWQTTSDRTGGGQAAVRFFQPNMNAEALMSVYQYFSKQADEVTGIPNYVYGNTGGGGVGRTASGLSMLMDNAAKGIKAAIGSIDVVVASLVERLYVHNMIYDADMSCKGDFKVVARGAMGLVAKEQLQVRRNEFLQATANPVDLQIIGPMGRSYLLREVAKSLQMDTDKLVPTTEQMEFRQDKERAAQMMQQAQMMQGQQQQAQAPMTLDAAGNPAGGAEANLMQ